MKSIFKTDSKQGMILIDPRTKLFILLIGNLSIFFASSLRVEITLVCSILVFGILCGANKFSFRMTGVYFLILITQVLSATYLSGSLRIMIVSFCMFIRKIFPCGILGGILISTTRVNEFMAAMNRIHMPKGIVIPLTVMLRYFPMIREDWHYIKDAMKMRDVSPSFGSLIVDPLQTIECVYVPLMMSASKIADELSAAVVTRGIENPRPRTCLQRIKFSYMDAICAICFSALLGLAIMK